jgi:hypothetical protein
MRPGRTTRAARGFPDRTRNRHRMIEADAVADEESAVTVHPSWGGTAALVALRGRAPLS